MWAIKLNDSDNMYLGKCVIPNHFGGLTVSRFPGNRIYQPQEFATEELARKIAESLNSETITAIYGKWEVVPFPREKK